MHRHYWVVFFPTNATSAFEIEVFLEDQWKQGWKLLCMAGEFWIFERREGWEKP